MGDYSFNDVKYQIDSFLSCERLCERHMNNGTFDEDLFRKFFHKWLEHKKLSDDFYARYHHYPEIYFYGEMFDESNIPIFVDYYNSNTITDRRYDENGKIIFKEPENTIPAPVSEEKTTGEKIAMVAGILLLILWITSRCGALGEEVKAKKIIDKMKKAGIELQDLNFVPYDINTEVIRPEDYPVRLLK